MSGATINFAYFPAPGGEMAVISGTTGPYSNMHMDWLGGARVVSNSQSHAVTVDQAYSPYGEVYSAFGSVPSQANIFAGTTANLYTAVEWDTPNRELSSVGRWLSPDPAGSGWNQYAYTTNPNSFIDPTGLDASCSGLSPDLQGTQGCEYSQAYQSWLYWNSFWNPTPVPVSGSGGSGSGFDFGIGIDLGSGFSGCGSDFYPCGLPPLGPSPIDILQQVLSGNLAGALQNAGIVPTDGVDCTSEVCIPNPLMDAGPSLDANAAIDCYHTINKKEPAPVRFFSLLSFTALNEKWKEAWQEFSIYLPFKVGAVAGLKVVSHAAADTAEAVASGATIGATTVDGLALTSCLPAAVKVPIGPRNVSGGHGPF